MSSVSKKFCFCFCFSFLIVLTVYFKTIAADPPKWESHDNFGRSAQQYPNRLYSTAENPNVKYNPNLPEDQRSKYVGKLRTMEVLNDVCTKRPDSGYYCMGSVGDIPPLHQRFYFDYYTKSCLCMLYNGCDGNANNFRTLDHCQHWCQTNMTIAKRRISDRAVYMFAQNKAKCLYFY